MDFIKIKTRLDKNYILNNCGLKRIKAEIELEVNEDMRVRGNAGVHYCVLLDVSGSMYAIDEKEKSKARRQSKKLTKIEGQYNAMAVTGVLAVVDKTITCIEKAVDRLGENDKISLIAYHEEARVIFQGLTKKDKAQIHEKLNALSEENNKDKATNISSSFKLANELMSKYPRENRKIIFLTDGRPSFHKLKNNQPIDTKEEAIKQNECIAKANIPMDYIGIELCKLKDEELDFAFLEELSKVANGNVHLADNEETIEIKMANVIEGSRESCITNAKLKIQFSKLVNVGEYYMVEPQQKYYPKMKLNEKRMCTIDLHELTKRKNYKFIFDIGIPVDEEIGEGTINMLKTAIHYKLNAEDDNIYKTPATILSVGIGSNAVEARKVDGDVIDAFTLASVKKFDDLYRKAYAKGDRECVISSLQNIIDIYHDQGYVEEERLNINLLNKYKEEGKITQSDINRSGASSSTVKKNIVKTVKLKLDI